MLSSIVAAVLLTSMTLINPVVQGAIITHTHNIPVSPQTITRANFTMRPSLPKEGLSRLVARQEFPATLQFCSQENCQPAGACLAVSIEGQFLNECSTIEDESFPSVFIQQPSGEGFPFEVLVGPAGCEEFAVIPAVNTCFNIAIPVSTFEFAEDI